MEKVILTTEQLDGLLTAIDQIEGRQYAEAIETLKGLQSGIDWNFVDEEDGSEAGVPVEQWTDQKKLDGLLYSPINSLHMLRLSGFDAHFHRRVKLEIEVIGGKKGAAEALEILTTTGAVAAEKALEQHDQTKPGRGKN